MIVEIQKFSDTEIELLEQQVPNLAKLATNIAYARAFLVSNRVLRVASGYLVWESSDGTKTVIAKAQRRRKVNMGEVISVRRLGGEKAGGRL